VKVLGRRTPVHDVQVRKVGPVVTLGEPRNPTSYRGYGAGYYAAYLLDPDGNNVEALYRDLGNIGHDAAPTLR
jgi:hypothetical protein